MTRSSQIDRNRLAAFVDGELSPEEAAAVVMHLADHPADQAYVDDLFAANAALAQAFAAPMTERIPDAIQTAIMGPVSPAATGMNIVPFRPRAAFMAGALALAASLAVATVLFRPAEPGALVIGPVASGSPLAEALDTLPSGAAMSDAAGRDLMILATLPTNTGHCREVEALVPDANQIELALICRDGTGWRIEVVVQESLAAAGTDGGFVTAEGNTVEGLSPFLDQRGAGLALTPAAEATLIDQGWAE